MKRLCELTGSGSGRGPNKIPSILPTTHYCSHNPPAESRVEHTVHNQLQFNSLWPVTRMQNTKRTYLGLKRKGMWRITFLCAHQQKDDKQSGCPCCERTSVLRGDETISPSRWDEQGKWWLLVELFLRHGKWPVVNLEEWCMCWRVSVRVRLYTCPQIEIMISMWLGQLLEWNWPECAE